MEDELRAKLRSEVLSAGWVELVMPFARGALLLAGPALDLLDAAEAIARDDRARVEAWLREGALARASDADAQRFTATAGLRFQFVIVQPWVLAQQLP